MATLLRLTGETLIDPKTNRTMLRCLCACGGEIAVRPADFRNGRAKSCGCLKRKAFIFGAAASRTHGKTHSPEWKTYYAMLERCYNQDHHAYKYYGGRGIKVCASWREGFQKFYDDKGDRPSGLTLDRRDTNGNYEPGNCRWATMKQQQRNRRSNVVLEAFGRKMTIVEWAEEIGIKYATLSKRIRDGVPVEAALSYPVTPRDQRNTVIME